MVKSSTVKHGQQQRHKDTDRGWRAQAFAMSQCELLMLRMQGALGATRIGAAYRSWHLRSAERLAHGTLLSQCAALLGRRTELACVRQWHQHACSAAH